ncbi:hypothetical protein IUY40_09300 [Flavobacterium sp. ALJ2]|uniref:hypothetical protein n=1 Tax=Flavobacterium sp. ALJ2 TaxID=2786960 RepID=UPI00189C9BCB|nr:hypothetical protein [Flavobacterium sp. ALJ2]MBF7091737.1 hypothetical protein [Flavobacterium sp. ALJ2]
MKHTYIYILIFLFLISCNSKAPIEVKQIISNELVTIEDNFMNRSIIKDSFLICLPTEYEIKINSPIHYINWSYHVNNKILNPNHIDYQVYNKKNNTKEILKLDLIKSNDKLINIIIKERNHLISKKDAEALIKKYHINKSVKDLEKIDFIELTTYNKFRTQNIFFINELNKINDTIMFKVKKEDESFFYLDKKINW